MDIFYKIHDNKNIFDNINGIYFIKKNDLYFATRIYYTLLISPNGYPTERINNKYF